MTDLIQILRQRAAANGGDKLLEDAASEIERLQRVCTLAHDELLSSASDREILGILESGWNPNAARGR